LPEVTVCLETDPNAQERPVGMFRDARLPPAAWREWEKATEALVAGQPAVARKHLENAGHFHDP
jgi:hypothetical protein